MRVPRLKENERVARIFRMHADKRRNLKEAGAGDIVAMTGLKRAATGDTLTAGEDVLLAGITFPEPVVSAALEAKSSAEEEKLQAALAKLAGDDPTFRVQLDENTGQTLISGMGELHLEVLEHRLTREFNVGVRVGKPMVTYRETITEGVASEAEYDRFTAGTENFARVELEIAPLPRGDGFIFESKVSEESMPANIQEVVRAACVDARESGIQYGYPVVDLRVTLRGGEWNEVRSTELAFRNATMDAFRAGLPQGRPDSPGADHVVGDRHTEGLLGRRDELPGRPPWPRPGQSAPRHDPGPDRGGAALRNVRLCYGSAFRVAGTSDVLDAVLPFRPGRGQGAVRKLTLNPPK